eukprot:COSAG01_NODE_5939_length_3941_cov_35.353462_2_plen_161_part_00
MAGWSGLTLGRGHRTQTWDKEGQGLDPSHPAAQSYYDSLVSMYADWGVDFIKWDCMYDWSAATYAPEAVLAVRAVQKVQRPIVLSWSPGGGMVSVAFSPDLRGLALGFAYVVHGIVIRNWGRNPTPGARCRCLGGGHSGWGRSAWRRYAGRSSFDVPAAR